MKSQLNQLQKKQTLLKIFIFTLVTVIIWVGLTLFRTQQETGIRPELIKKAEALNPNINVEVIEQLEQKQAYTAEELADFPIYSILTTKSGEEQLVVFSASDRTKKVVQPGESITNPQVSQIESAGNPAAPNGATVTVERPNPESLPTPTELPQAIQ